MTREKTGHATLDDVLTAVAGGDTQIYFPVAGDCLEAVGISSGDMVLVDFTRFPAPPRYKARGGDGSVDVCLCYGKCLGAAPGLMLKAYDGIFGRWTMVSTCYDLDKGEHRMNCSFPAERILGVVIQVCTPAGAVKWERDPNSFPEVLDMTPTIFCDNAADPRPSNDPLGKGVQV